MPRKTKTRPSSKKAVPKANKKSSTKKAAAKKKAKRASAKKKPAKKKNAAKQAKKVARKPPVQPAFVDEAGAREHPRAAVNLSISYETLDQFFHDYATNISVGGVFIRTRHPAAIGTELKVAFALPGLEGKVETTGRVVHVQGETAESPGGMGIRFEDLSKDSKKIIDHLVMESFATNKRIR